MSPQLALDPITQQQIAGRRMNPIPLAMGVALILLALLTPGMVLERALGRAPDELSWGPLLFRALLVWHGSLLALFAFWRPQIAATVVRPAAWPWISLVSLSVLAFLLRIWRLDTCLWLDEILTMADFARQPLATIWTSFPNQNQHMLYSLLARASLVTFGESAWALRLPSVLFGVGSIWALYGLGRRVVGPREALLACGLMTVSYHHVWFSQNARGYMGLLLFATLATWLWLEALERRDWRFYLAYSTACFLGLWVHMTMAFVLVAHVFVYCLFLTRPNSEERRAGWLPWAAWALAATLIVQAQALALPEFLRSAVGEVSKSSDWTNPLWVVTESLRSLQVGFSGVVVVAFGGALVLAGFFDLLRRAPRTTLLMVTPAVLGGGLMLALSHNLWPRFFFFSMGFALLVVIHGATVLPRWVLPRERFAPIAGMVLAGLMILASSLTLPRCYALPKQDFTGAREFVEQTNAPGDSVAVVGLAGHAYGRYYAKNWTVLGTATELHEFHRTHPGLALVYTLPTELRAFHPELWGVVEREFSVVRIFPGTLGNGEVYVCRERNSEHTTSGSFLEKASLSR